MRDPELVAITKIRTVLEGLPGEAAHRVLSYVVDRVRSDQIAKIEAAQHKMAQPGILGGSIDVAPTY